MIILSRFYKLEKKNVDTENKLQSNPGNIYMILASVNFLQP